MARWKPRYEDPITYDYFGHRVNKCGPWSQAPVFLQQLAILEGFDLDSLAPDSPDLVHVIVESAKLAYADREAYYGDPDFVDVPLDRLLSEDYSSARRDLVGPDASHELRPGTIEGHGSSVDYAAAVERAERQREARGAGEPTMGPGAPVVGGPVGGDTVHLDIIDRWGNMVSATPSGGWFQSSPAIPALGFALGSRAQMFWLDDTHPNRLEPGKRPRTTLTPGLALRDGEPYLAFGTPGGEGQDQWALTFFLRHVHHGLNLQEAIDAPAFHCDHWPSSFWPRGARPARLVVEDRYGTEAIDDLRSWGHDVRVGPSWSEGRLCAASRSDGVLRAAANPRGAQNYAVGR
jgi:gamma-glutamyltranspeptidase/glutathione hydrolase